MLCKKNVKISFPMHFLIHGNPIFCRRTQPCELGSGDHGQDVEYGPRHVERRHQHVRPDEHGVRTVGRHRVRGRGGRHQSHQRQCEVPGEKGVWSSRDAQRQRAHDIQPEGRWGHHRTVIDPPLTCRPRTQTRILYYIIIIITVYNWYHIKNAMLLPRLVPAVPTTTHDTI